MFRGELMKIFHIICIRKVDNKFTNECVLVAWLSGCWQISLVFLLIHCCSSLLSLWCCVRMETVAMLNVKKHKTISKPQRHPHTPQADQKRSHQQHSHTHSHTRSDNAPKHSTYCVATSLSTHSQTHTHTPLESVLSNHTKRKWDNPNYETRTHTITQPGHSAGSHNVMSTLWIYLCVFLVLKRVISIQNMNTATAERGTECSDWTWNIIISNHQPDLLRACCYRTLHLQHHRDLQ